MKDGDIKLGTFQRIVICKRTKEMHIVYHNDMEKWQVNCYERVDLIGRDHIRSSGKKTFRHDEVEIKNNIKLTNELATKLYEQYTQQEPIAEQLLEGMYIDETIKGVRSITKNQNYGTPSKTLKCPVCDKEMMLRRNPQGGLFHGCRNFARFGCEITCDLAGERWWKLPETVS